jgi:glycosyltransferase involved in cell wall biosynthesis
MFHDYKIKLKTQELMPKLTSSKPFDLIYIEGPGNIVDSLELWHSNDEVLTVTSLTFSGQVFDFCKRNNLNTLAISWHHEPNAIEFENFAAVNLPKKVWGGSLGYHLSQIIYGLRLLWLILRYQPKYVHITSGVTYLFLFAPLKLFNIKIFPQFHNTFWTKGFPKENKIHKILLFFDAWFLKKIASGAMCCSEEVKRQIEKITRNQSCPVYVFKPQFNRVAFDVASPPPAHNHKPFTIVFAGRAERDKGIFDILEMVKKLKSEAFEFHICGGGSALEELKQACLAQGLSGSVKIHGHLDRPKLINIYSLGHIVIVPTRSSFSEGFAMVAAESILLNRPVIASSVVPATELLKDACLEVPAEDVDGFIKEIRTLSSNQDLYESMCLACSPLKEQFLNGKEGLTNVLEKTL